MNQASGLFSRLQSFASRLSSVIAGLSPESAALLIAVGFVLGTFPVLGLATLLCAGAALALRLNMPALQAVNQIATPAQYALIVPFARIGARITGHLPGFSGAVVHAVTGWFCVAVPLGFVLYAALAHVLRRHLGQNLNVVETAA